MNLDQALADLSSAREELAILKAEKDHVEAQWGVMARACGNWREFNAESPTRPLTEWETKEYQAAARAILERDELRAELARLQPYVQHKAGCPSKFNVLAEELTMPACTCGLTPTAQTETGAP